MNELKGVIIGAGFFAQFHAEAWARIDGMKIVALADPDLEKAQAFAEQWNIPNVYDNAEKMLQQEKPDFVDIITRPDSHLTLTQLAASFGANVICQKPMAPKWDECLMMVSTYKDAGVRLLMHENWRWQPWYREIKKLIEADTFGKIFHLGFHMRTGDGRGENPYTAQPYFKEMPRLFIYETGVHFLDTFRYLAGEISSLYCQTNRVNPFILGEDYATVNLTFTSNARGIIDANRIAGPRVPEIAFGTFSLEGERASLRMTPQGDLWINIYDQPEFLHSYHKPTIGYKGDSIFALQEHFVDCLLSGAGCESEGEEYLKTVKAVLACYESAEQNRVVNLL